MRLSRMFAATLLVSWSLVSLAFIPAVQGGTTMPAKAGAGSALPSSAASPPTTRSALVRAVADHDRRVLHTTAPAKTSGNPPLVAAPADVDFEAMVKRMEALAREVTTLKEQLGDTKDTVQLLTLRVDELSDKPPKNCTLECPHGGHPDRMCVSCVACDYPWSGSRCADCSLPCQHDSVPNEDCTSCVACPVGWKGQLCEIWDDAVPLNDTEQYLTQLVQDGRSAVEELYSRERAPLPGVVGTGFDPTTGQLKLPAVKLSFDPESTSTWTSPNNKTYLIPKEVTYESVPGKDYPELASQTHQTLDRLNQWWGKQVSSLTWTGGFYTEAHDLLEVFHKHFSDKKLLSVTQQSYAIYELALPFSSDKTRQYTLDRHAQRAVDYLPPTWKTGPEKTLYREFLEQWGTHFTTSAKLGGMVELQSQLLDCLTLSYSPEELSVQANRDFKGVIEGKDSAVDARYRRCRTLGALAKHGGEPSIESLSEWLDSIENNPVSIHFRYAEVSQLIADKAKKANMQQAVAEYLRANSNKRTEDLETAKSELAAALSTPKSVTWRMHYSASEVKARVSGSFMRRIQAESAGIGKIDSVASSQTKPLDLNGYKPYHQAESDVPINVISVLSCERNNLGQVRAVAGKGTGSKHSYNVIDGSTAESSGEFVSDGCSNLSHSATFQSRWTGHGSGVDGTATVEFSISCCLNREFKQNAQTKEWKETTACD